MLTRSAQSRFAKDERGVTAIIFALSMIPLFAMVGCAIDGVLWYKARQEASTAIDSAVLAGARAMQIAPNDTTGALAVAAKYYATNWASRPSVINDTVQFIFADNNTSITFQGSSYYKTSFLAVVGISQLPIKVPSKASWARGLNSGSNLELSLMLDLTGSMCDDGNGPCTSGVKVVGLRDASTDLINIVIPDTAGPYSSRVAIVPFATNVRVAVDGDGALMKQLTNLDPTWSGWQNICTQSTGGGGGETGGNWQCQRYQAQYQQNLKVMPCVTDRAYGTGGLANDVYDVTDEAPGAGRWLNAHGGDRFPLSNDSTDTATVAATGQSQSAPGSQWNYDSAGFCETGIPQTNTVIPLSADKTLLKNRIAQLSAGGSTAGALSTAWAWYMLSPKWSSVWTGASAPGSYSDVTAKQSNGAPVLRKVAVLMTDGVYNTYRVSAGQDAALMSQRAKTLCTNMKAKGIEIYAVGFGLDQLTAGERAGAEDLLKSCAEDLSHFYSSLTVDSLKIAFRDIALKVMPIRLTN